MTQVTIEGDYTLVKADDDQRRIFGWANVSVRKDGTLVVDSDGEAILPDDLEEAAYQFVLKFRETGDSHRGEAKGSLIESMVFTTEKMAVLGIPEGTVHEGWWTGFELDSQEDFEKIKAGERRMFSIQGRSMRTEVGSAAA